MPEALASVTNASIRGFYRLAVRTIDDYSAGLCCGTEEFKRMYIDHIGRWKTSQSGELVSLWTVQLAECFTGKKLKIFFKKK